MYLLGLIVGVTIALNGQNDPTGFVDLLNIERTNRGLYPLIYDPGCAECSAINNEQQIIHGVPGHFFSDRIVGQCAAWDNTMQGALYQWLNAPFHAKDLLSTNVIYVGYAQKDKYHTVSTAIYRRSLDTDCQYRVNIKGMPVYVWGVPDPDLPGNILWYLNDSRNINAAILYRNIR